MTIRNMLSHKSDLVGITQPTKTNYDLHKQAFNSASESDYKLAAMEREMTVLWQ